MPGRAAPCRGAAVRRCGRALPSGAPVVRSRGADGRGAGNGRRAGTAGPPCGIAAGPGGTGRGAKHGGPGPRREAAAMRAPLSSAGAAPPSAAVKVTARPRGPS